MRLLKLAEKKINPILVIAIVGAFFLFAGGPGFKGAIVDDLVAFYPLDVDTQDYSGNSLHGINHGVTFSNNEGVFVDAEKDYIELPAANLLFPNANSWSVSVWFKSNKVDFFDFVIDGDLWQIRGSQVAGDIYVQWNDGTGLVFDSISGIQTGQKYHMVVTYDGTTRRVYLNGNQAASKDVNPTFFSSDNLFIGSLVGDVGTFDGTIDEVRYYSRPITQAEVTELFSGSTPPPQTCTDIRSELGTAITQWIGGQISRNELGIKIQEWVDC